MLAKVLKALRVISIVVILSAALLIPVQNNYAEEKPVKIWILWSCIYVEF